jgi:hypothetical protein
MMIADQKKKKKIISMLDNLIENILIFSQLKFDTIYIMLMSKCITY